MDENPAIGIDLGTTYCCMAVYNRKTQRVDIIPNEIGENTTPSYISLNSDDSIIVGRESKTSPAVDQFHTIFDIKRLIGRRFDDPVLQEDLKLWPFDIIQEDGAPKVVRHNKSYYPEQISAKVLAHLKHQAEEYLEHPVNRAVITVPAYFNDGQRQATKDAGTIAGFEVLRLLNEPTAAAITHCHQFGTNQGNILVFDLGGGTLDIAVLTVKGRHVSIKAVGGDAHLGGEDFDNSLVTLCVQKFEEEHSINLPSGKNSKDLTIKTKTAKSLRRLKNKCEECKGMFTQSSQIVIALDALWDTKDLCVSVTLDQFNSLNMHHFEKCIQIMNQVIIDSGLKKSSINEIILAGGSTRIVKLQEMISGFFNGKKLNKKINGDEAIAYGAALQAAFMTFTDEMLAEVNETIITIQDVVPLPIGIEAYEKGTKIKTMKEIIGKNTPIPCFFKKNFATAYDGHHPTISIYEGENPIPEKNHLLGKFQTKNLPVNCKKGESIQITMHVNVDGILTVTASYESSDKVDEITVDASKGRLTAEQVSELRILQEKKKIGA